MIYSDRRCLRSHGKSDAGWALPLKNSGLPGAEPGISRHETAIRARIFNAQAGFTYYEARLQV